ncbi:MAG: hypothetical protein H7250_09045 [Flavobacterium sp.]|nr:hypothetical protein [Flavobacterium sp.]
MTDQYYVENDRQVSPDSSMLLISYSLDLGAFGYGQAGTAILKLSDTTKNLREFTIPNTLTSVKWIDNKNVSAQFDILSSLRTGDKVELKDIEVNGIRVKVSALDYIDKDDRQEIEHRELSPNGQFELVAYRYLKDKSNLNFSHISVIPVGGQIPKYGNYLIADMQSDYVIYATWTKNNELQFYTNSQYSDLVQYYLVDSRPKINFKIVTDDKKYGSKYRWTEKSGI